MLRTNNLRIQQQLKPLYRQGLFAIRYESTVSSSSPVAAAETAENKPKKTEKTEKRIPLSERLGGSGRGKILDNSDGKTNNNDVFATFLLQAQKKERARKENKQRRNMKERSEAKPGQFDDAVEDNIVNNTNQRKSQQAFNKNSTNNNNNNNNNNSNNSKRQGQQRSRDRKGQQQPRQNMKKKTASGGSTAIPVRRATTFIDKDIDWTSLSSVDISKQSLESEQKEGQDQASQQLEVENGDYSRFISVGQSIQWPANINKQALESLVSTNSSYGLDQKLVFLETVAKASNVGGASVKK
ncbi:hypothetical protein BJ944DRAFT_264960 [Cunninghamella echinulata]|nr:hypothetical protein BJ944DRAFT_264960 [Cunninghamella echinulata]